jgi:hypothetical protein
MGIPDDLQAAIDASPKAKAMLAKLNAQNRFALAFGVHYMKTEAGRKKKIAAFVEMLKRGETIYPETSGRGGASQFRASRKNSKIKRAPFLNLKPVSLESDKEKLC